MQVQANGIQIEVEISGPEHGPVLLLLMGLGMQLIDWPETLVQELNFQGFRVIRMDNRDSGLSEKFDHKGHPNLWTEGFKHRMGWATHAPYTLSDMARDSLGVLDRLGIAQAHVIGVSMGGMIAQRMALIAPQRMHSLVSIMSSSGARDLPTSDPSVLKALLGYPSKGDANKVIEHYVHLFSLISSPAWPTSEAVLRQRVRKAVARGASRSGTQRQTLAAMIDDVRAKLLNQIRLPALVIHGKDDLLLPYAHGIDTARRITGAELMGIAGMGHDLPEGLLPVLLPRLSQFLQQHTPGWPDAQPS
jgi:pimeloyl-ACP methyl ester carboxylesterase